MKVKNTSLRNVVLIGRHQLSSQKAIKRVLIVAGSTLELEDEEWAVISEAARDFIKAGVLKVIETPESFMSKEQIAKKIMDDTGVKIDVNTKSKKEIQKLAESLSVIV